MPAITSTTIYFGIYMLGALVEPTASFGLFGLTVDLRGDCLG